MVGPATTAVNGCLKTNLSSASFVSEYSAHLCCRNNGINECLSTTPGFDGGYATLHPECSCVGGYASLLPKCGGGGGGHVSLLPRCGGGGGGGGGHVSLLPKCGGGGGGGGHASLLPECTGCCEKASLRLDVCRKSP